MELAIELNKSCYAIRAIKPFVSLKVLISIYFSYFHSLLTYGVMFWSNSHITKDILKIQKRVVRIITNNSRHESCRHLFKQLKILTLPLQYVFSVLVFIAMNRNLFLSNSDIHSFNTQNNLDLHLPSTHLTVVQKGVLYSGQRHLSFIVDIYCYFADKTNAMHEFFFGLTVSISVLFLWKAK
jgi:hypothetical protein